MSPRPVYSDPHVCQTTTSSTSSTEKQTSRTTIPATPVNPSSTNSGNVHNTTEIMPPNGSTGSSSNTCIITGSVCVVLALLIIAALIMLFVGCKQGRFDSCLGFKGNSDRYDDVVTVGTISPYSETEFRRYQVENNIILNNI